MKKKYSCLLVLMYDADRLIDINVQWAQWWEENESENKKKEEKEEEQEEGGVKVIVNTNSAYSICRGMNV